MSTTGYYYLHENGSLIFKPDHDGIVADFRDSDLVRCFWPMDPTCRLGAWTILVEGTAFGADQSRINDLAQKWGCDDADADIYARHIGVTIELDGNAWCATGPSFENLQKSNAGFGATKLAAIGALAKVMGLQPGKMWNPSFRDLLLQAKAAA